MKTSPIYSLFVFILLYFFSYNISIAQVLFTEDFDGSNTTNPIVLSTGSNCFLDNQDFFGIFDDATVGASYTNDSGNFLIGQDVDECPNGSNTETAMFTGIDISSCPGDLYICIDIAEDDLASDGVSVDLDLDDNDGIEFNVSIDGGASATVIEFKSVASNSEAYAGDSDLSSCTLTDDFVTYCAAIPAGSTLDLEIAIRSNGGSEDTAADNIQLICGEANLPATSVDYESCLPMCNSSLVITEVMYDPCSSSGSGTDDCFGTTGNQWMLEANGQWVEIYNYGATTSDISGYLIGDENNSDIYEVPAGTMIAPGEYLVIAHEDVGNCMIASGINAVVGLDPGTNNPQNSNTFNQGNDDVELKDPNGTLCDLVGQYPGDDCSNNNDGFSYSLSIDPSSFVDGSENDNLADWGPSLNGANVPTIGGGSPGAANTMGACLDNIASVAATCNGTTAEFTITFDYAFAFSTDYDILVDGVVQTTSTGNALGSGSVSQMVSIPLSTIASTVDIEVRPAGADFSDCFELVIDDFPLPACIDCNPTVPVILNGN